MAALIFTLIYAIHSSPQEELSQIEPLNHLLTIHRRKKARLKKKNQQRLFNFIIVFSTKHCSATPGHLQINYLYTKAPLWSCSAVSTGVDLCRLDSKAKNDFGLLFRYVCPPWVESTSINKWTKELVYETPCR